MESAPFKLKNWITSFTILAAAIVLMGGCALANHPPTITSLKAELETVSPSGLCHIECIASDRDGDELSYGWSASDGNLDGDGAAVNWSAPDSEGIYNITVEVTDGNGGEVTDSITINVRVNDPPAITSLKADMDWVTPSGSCNITCNAEDPDGDELIYKWSADGGDISGIGSVVTWAAPDAVGLYNITVVVSDGYGGEGTRSLSISVALNPPPSIELVVTSEEPMKETKKVIYVLRRRSYNIECVVSDSESDELSYEWSASGENTDGGQISGESSTVTWTAPDVTDAGFVIDKVTITVVVSDANGNISSKSIILKVETCTCAFS